MSSSAQIRCGSGQGPAAAVDTDFPADFFKLAVAEIVKQILAASVLRILETLGHDARCGEMPKVDTLRIVAADEKVEESVAVVIEPDGGVRVDRAAGRPARLH